MLFKRKKCKKYTTVPACWQPARKRTVAEKLRVAVQLCLVLEMFYYCETGKQCSKAGVHVALVIVIWHAARRENTTADQYKVVYHLSIGAIFNDLELPLTQISRSRQYFTLNTALTDHI